MPTYSGSQSALNLKLIVHRLQDAIVEKAIKPGVRVTLRMGGEQDTVFMAGHQLYRAELASPAAPREELGQYWGYITRIAPNLNALFNECPFKGGSFAV